MNNKVLLSGICFALGLTMNAQNTFPSSGYVGLGTTTPETSLHIKETFPVIRVQATSSGSPRVDLGVVPSATYLSNIAQPGDAVFRAGLYDNSLIIGNEFKYAGNDIKFTTTAPSESGASTKLIIKNDGNIGIGTETPDAKLAVNGDIHSKEVRIDLNNWPDYVFDENYNLPTIIEAEQHIQEKGYLINMPSAQAIETNGLQLGEVTRLQQEKIEELMLYIIELNKRIELLEQQTTQKQ